MEWKEIAKLEELKDESVVLKITDQLKLSLPALKQQLLGLGKLRLGKIELRIDENKILALLPVHPMPHIID